MDWLYLYGSLFDYHVFVYICMNWYLLETINLSRGENREQQIFPFTASIVSFTKDLQRITTDSCCQLNLNRFFIGCESFFIFHEKRP